MSFLKGQIIEIIGGEVDVGERALVLSTSYSTYLKTTVVQASTKFERWMSRGYPLDHVKMAEAKPKYSGFDLNEDFAAILCGLVQVPNWKPYETLEEGVNAIAAGGGTYAVPNLSDIWLPGTDRPSWGRAFLWRGQSTGFTGEGTAMVWSNRNNPQIGRFALCKHEHRLRTAELDGRTDRPNHQRGWHPGICAKCGLNLDVDSGD